MPIKVIVFDLWNTLVYDSSKEEQKKIAKLLGFKTKEEFWDYCDAYFFGRKLTFYDFLKEFIEQKKLPKNTFEKVKKLWKNSKAYVNVYPDTIETLKRLKKKYKLVLLSNTAEKEGEESISRFDIKKYFDQIIFSCSVGLSKPNPKIFQLILDKTKVKPEEVVIVGDNLEMDIIPARILSFKGILIDTRKKYPEYKGKEWHITSLKKLKL